MNAKKERAIIERLRRLEHITSKPKEFCEEQNLEQTSYAYCIGACEALVKAILFDIEDLESEEQ